MLPDMSRAHMVLHSAEIHMAINPYYPDWITQVQRLLPWFQVLDQEEEYTLLQQMEKNHRQMEFVLFKKPQGLSTSINWTAQIRYMSKSQWNSTYRRGHVIVIFTSCWCSKPSFSFGISGGNLSECAWHLPNTVDTGMLKCYDHAWVCSCRLRK